MAHHAASENPATLSTPELAGQFIVTQPKKMEQILSDLNTIATFEARISERVGEDRSGDWSGGTGGAAGQGDDGQVSARDQAIANLPEPVAMRRQLTARIEQEVKILQKKARHEARRASKPGAAYRLTEFYARIRRLNGLLSSLAEAAYDVLKRLYIRVVIDKQKMV